MPQMRHSLVRFAVSIVLGTLAVYSLLFIIGSFGGARRRAAHQVGAHLAAHLLLSRSDITLAVDE